MNYIVTVEQYDPPLIFMGVHATIEDKILVIWKKEEQPSIRLPDGITIFPVYDVIKAAFKQWYKIEEKEDITQPDLDEIIKNNLKFGEEKAKMVEELKKTITEEAKKSGKLDKIMKEELNADSS